ncbi:hypothetical protein HN51_061667, partial [Arachis hypogaea]
FTYSHFNILSMVRHFTNDKELVRHAITRFATSFLSLERLYEEKENLRKMFTLDEWVRNKLLKEAKEREATKMVISPSFWNHVKYTLKIMGPLVWVLRLVDGEKKPPIDYIYEAMEKAKECIMKTFSNDVSKYTEMKLPTSSTSSSVACSWSFRNPELFYDNPLIELDLEVTKWWFEFITRLVSSPAVQEKILEDILCNEWLVGGLRTTTFQSDDNVEDDAGLVHESDNTLSWNLVFESMRGDEPTTNTRRQQNRKGKQPVALKGGPSGSKASKKGNAIIVEEEEEPEFENSEDSKNEEEIQFNDTDSDDDKGAEEHDNNRVNLDKVDES